MKLKPLQDWTLIQRVEPAEKTAAGIIIPDSAKDKPTEGIVLAIGPGKFKTEKGKDKKKEKKFIPTVLKPGQRVIYGKYSAREFEVDGEPIVLVREEDVLGTVEERSMAKRQRFEIVENVDKPLTVRKESKLIKVEPPSTRKKTLVKKSATEKETASKSSGKIQKKKTLSSEKDSPKTVTKKTAVNHAPEKSLRKATVLKKTDATEKKASEKKIKPKKAVQKQTTGKDVKKTIQKKAATTIKQSLKKTASKGKAKK